VAIDLSFEAFASQHGSGTVVAVRATKEEVRNDGKGEGTGLRVGSDGARQNGSRVRLGLPET